MSKNATAEKNAAETNSNLPLFFKQPVPLNMQRHATAGLLPVQDFSFAINTNSLMINAAEFFEAVKYYPIVFSQSQTPMPVAVVGLEQKNLFINRHGKWREDTYIPAYVRRYPFVFSDVPDSDKLMLCIDEAATQFKAQGHKDAQPLFNEGEPSNLSKSALEFCTAFYSHNEMTRRFCEDIQKAGILAPSHTDAKTASGREINLGGFQMIDEKKLNALPQETIMDFFKKGWLPFIYAALISSSNWRSLVELTDK